MTCRNVVMADSLIKFIVIKSNVSFNEDGKREAWIWQAKARPSSAQTGGQNDAARRWVKTCDKPTPYVSGYWTYIETKPPYGKAWKVV